jgi:hypothetical protein
MKTIFLAFANAFTVSEVNIFFTSDRNIPRFLLCSEKNEITNNSEKQVKKLFKWYITDSKQIYNVLL